MTKRKLASQVFLLALIGGMGALFVLTLSDPAQEFYLSAAAVVLVALSLLVERFFPLDPEWNKTQGDLTGDVISFVAIFGLLDGVLKAVLPFLLLAILPTTGAVDWPLLAQIVAVILLMELGAWVSHWAHHRYPTLWALHAMHHSPERLYTLNNFRFHPLNHVFNHLALFVPVLLIGFSSDALLAYAALGLPVLILQHTNARFDFGVLNRVLNTNDLHRWHHSTDPREGMKNLGRATVIWDRVFGTYFNPGITARPRALGLFAASRRFPAARQFAAQLAWPFSRDCCA